MTWVVGDDKVKMLELDEMLEYMCAYACMDEVAEVLCLNPRLVGRVFRRRRERD